MKINTVSASVQPIIPAVIGTVNVRFLSVINYGLKSIKNLNLCLLYAGVQNVRSVVYFAVKSTLPDPVTYYFKGVITQSDFYWLE
jgi:hypothetical protein